jgi:hypothetical protein
VPGLGLAAATTEVEDVPRHVYAADNLCVCPPACLPVCLPSGLERR